MGQTKKENIVYRTTFIQGLGKVRVPAQISDDEVVSEVFGTDLEATPTKKSKKKT